jgi:hypothetical protein
VSLTRKNLMVDAEALRALARARGTSESEAVREAIAQALAWSGMAGALDELRRLGAFANTARMEAMYGPLPAPRDELVPQQPEQSVRRRSS